ncbi:MAG: sodium/proline symporter, partial [Sulfolobales archaeon]
MSTIVVSSFIIYSIICIVIGYIAARKTKTWEDFVIGGRRLGTWVTSLAYQSTALSGWLYMAYAGLAYTTGLFPVAWLSIGSGLAPLISFIVLGERIRRLTQVTNAYSTIDLLEKRFDDTKRLIRVTAVITIFISMTVYAAGQFMATGTLLSRIFGISYEHGVIAGSIVVVTYCLLGGYLAAALTDMFQGVLMLVGATTLGVLALINTGGLVNLVNQLETLDPKLVNPWIYPTVAAGYIMGAWLGYLGQPQLVVRFMSAKGLRNVLNSIPIVSITAPVLLVSCGIAGAASRILIPDLKTPDVSIIVLSETYFHPVFAGILIGAILAAIMSTADALVITAVTTVTRDLYHAMLRPKATQRELMWINRILTFIMGLFCLITAIRPFEAMLWVMWWGWAALTSFAPPFLCAAYWKRATREGIFAGIVCGFVATITWYQLGWYTWLHASGPAFAFSLLACIIVSLITKPTDNAVKVYEKSIMLTE